MSGRPTVGITSGAKLKERALVRCTVLAKRSHERTSTGLRALCVTRVRMRLCRIKPLSGLASETIWRTFALGIMRKAVPQPQRFIGRRRQYILTAWRHHHTHDAIFMTYTKN